MVAVEEGKIFCLIYCLDVWENDLNTIGIIAIYMITISVFDLFIVRYVLGLVSSENVSCFWLQITWFLKFPLPKKKKPNTVFIGGSLKIRIETLFASSSKAKLYFLPENFCLKRTARSTGNSNPPRINDWICICQTSNYSKEFLRVALPLGAFHLT